MEKDTQQLVIANSDFQVVQRFKERRAERPFGFELKWSPDERFIIWRNQVGFDYFSNWEGFAMDLKTGEKKDLAGPFMGDQIDLTGHGGEFIDCGRDGVRSMVLQGYDLTGAHLTIHPDDMNQPKDIWRITVPPRSHNLGLMTYLGGGGPLRISPDATLFALAIPKMKTDRVQWRWHLIDRAGRIWEFPGADRGENVAPYELAGFADNGKQIIGYDSSRLFSIPVSTIMNDANLTTK